MKPEDISYKSLFKMPKPVKVSGRISSITNAFINGIIPCIVPTEIEIKEALDILGMGMDIRCAYCGGTCTEWDHFRPLVENQKPSGYITEINNLVPACGKCNQSKGNKKWHEWINSSANLSPRARGVKDLDLLISRIKKYEEWSKPVFVDFKSILGAQIWDQHWKNWEKLCADMKKYQVLSNEIQTILHDRIVIRRAGSKPALSAKNK